MVPSELGDVWTRPDRLIVGHRMAPPSYRGQPVPLSNGMYLNVQIALQVIRNPIRLAVTDATFTYQAGVDGRSPSRWSRGPLRPVRRHCAARGVEWTAVAQPAGSATGRCIRHLVRRIFRTIERHLARGRTKSAST